MLPLTINTTNTVTLLSLSKLLGNCVSPCVISEAIRWAERPGGRKILVLGVNNTNIKLEWRWDLEGATFRDVQFERQKPGENKAATVIASRFDNFGFTVFDQFVNEYDAKSPATLTLKNVDNNEEYIYTIVLSSLSSRYLSTLKDQVTVVVYGT